MNKSFKFLSLASTLALLGTQAVAEEIKSIDVEGNIRVENSTVLSYLGTYAGDEYNPNKLNQALKDLYGTGLFADVAIRWDDGSLVIEVEENALVNEVRFEGNDNLNDDLLKPLLQVKTRAIFSPSKVQADVNEILGMYRNSGYFLAKIEPKLIRRDQNRVDVIYDIDEGEKTSIESIKFIGNKEFSDNDLAQVITTKESAWWRFLSSADSYDPNRLEFDKELLRRHYLRYGYADARVVSAVAELSKERDRFYITFTVSEGPEYNFGALDVKISDDINVTAEELSKFIGADTGDLYDASQVDRDIEALIDALGAKGYAFLDVVPQVRKNDAEQTVDIIYDVRPGPKVYVNRINIMGNTRTKDYVIRREMRLAEGDAFSSDKLKRSEDRIRVTDYFADVQLERKETPDPDRMDLDVTVQEQSTGEFNIGAGLSSYEGVIGTLDLRERNFLGRGQELALSLGLSSERQDINFSFVEPWFAGREISLGVDVFNYERQFQDQASYDERRTGAGLSFGKPLNEYLRTDLFTRYSNTEISDVDSAASVFVQNETGEKDSLIVGNTISYDTRDSRIMPTRGKQYSWTIEHSGLGSDIEFVRNELKAATHIPLGNQLTLSLGGRLGHVWDYNDSLPLFENFFLGGQSLRGFDRAGIGPRDSATNDALGGRIMAGHNIELRYPISFLQDLGIQGTIFNDGGIVTDFRDEGSSQVLNDEIYRMSVGAGIFWRSPLGPLRFDLGFPIVKAEEDERQVFSFSFGTRF